MNRIDDKGGFHTAHPLRLWEKKPAELFLERINAAIKDPVTLDHVAEIVSATVKHDDAVKKTVFLTMLLFVSYLFRPGALVWGRIFGERSRRSIIRDSPLAADALHPDVEILSPP